MAAITLRLQSGADGNFAAANETDQTAATRTDGWTVGKVATAFSAEFDAGTKQATGAFTAQGTTAKPASFLTGTTANAIKSAATYRGDLAATAWTLTFAVRATVVSAQTGRIRCRVFASKNADGSSARELTAATQVGTTSAVLSTSADVTSVVTWTPAAAIFLNDEYIFIVIAWETVTAGGSNTADVQLRTGQSAGGTRIVTSNYVAATAISGSDTGSGADAISLKRALDTDANVPSAGTGGFTGAGDQVTDTFTRADETPIGGNWSGPLLPGNRLGLVSNAMQATTSGGGTAYWAASRFGVNHEISVKCPNTPGNVMDVYVAWDEVGDNGYIVEISSPVETADLYSVAGGTPTWIATLSVASAVFGGDVVKIRATLSGSTWTITEYINGTQVGQLTDTTVPSFTDCVVGLGTDGISNIYDNFTAQSLTLSGGADSASVTTSGGTTSKSGSDSGSSSEATTEIAAESGSDANGTTTEATTEIASPSVSDSNSTTTEASSVTVPISGTDTNGATTESATYTFAFSSSDANGATTEAVTEVNRTTTTDANGTTTETQNVTVPVAASDSNGVTTEIATFVNATTTTDSGTATEAVSGLSRQAADTNGTTTEAITGISISTTQDTGTASTEGSNVTVPVSATDTNSTTTENSIETAQYSNADSNGYSETATPRVVETAADTGSGADNANTNTPISSSDSNGATTENITLVFLTSVSDANGTTTEAATLRLAASDANSVTTETVNVASPVSAADSNSTTTEAFSEIARPNGADANGTTTEIGGTGTNKVDTDASTGADTISAKNTTAAESGTDTEASAATIRPVSSDSGSSTETASPAFSASGGTDTGFGADSGSLTFSATRTDTSGPTTETSQAVASYQSSDLASSTDAGSLTYVRITDAEFVIAVDEAVVGGAPVQVGIPGVPELLAVGWGKPKMITAGKQADVQMREAR